MGYFSYHDIKVYLDGEQDRAIARDKQTIEARLFGEGTKKLEGYAK